MLTVLTLTKYLQNLLRDSTLTAISIAKKILILSGVDYAENAKWNFLFNHPISCDVFLIKQLVKLWVPSVCRFFTKHTVTKTKVKKPAAGSHLTLASSLIVISCHSSVVICQLWLASQLSIINSQLSFVSYH